MKHIKLIGLIFIIALLVLGIETLYLVQRNTATPDRIKVEASQNRNRLSLKFKQRLRELERDYEKKKNLATGKTVFDRIYNTQDQSIVDLIMRISREALPEEWSVSVKVEEFTHFILLIYPPHNAQQIPTEKIVSYLRPILNYCGWLLSDVAVFDRTHKGYMFFDKPMLLEIKKNRKLSQLMLDRAEKHGQSFIRFNSVTIEGEKHGSHLVFLLEVAGIKGVVSCLALFDTGASITMLSNRVVSTTGSDNLQNAPRRSFNTANGRMSCPIVTREVNVGGFRKGIEVAVNQRDEINLLGLNFFEGLNYIVDFQKSAIYVWEK